MQRRGLRHEQGPAAGAQMLDGMKGWDVWIIKTVSGRDLGGSPAVRRLRRRWWW